MVSGDVLERCNYEDGVDVDVDMDGEDDDADVDVDGEDDDAVAGNKARLLQLLP